MRTYCENQHGENGYDLLETTRYSGRNLSFESAEIAGYHVQFYSSIQLAIEFLITLAQHLSYTVVPIVMLQSTLICSSWHCHCLISHFSFHHQLNSIVSFLVSNSTSA